MGKISKGIEVEFELYYPTQKGVMLNKGKVYDHELKPRPRTPIQKEIDDWNYYKALAKKKGNMRAYRDACRHLDRLYGQRHREKEGSKE